MSMDASQDESFRLISPPGIRRNSAGVEATHRDTLSFSPWAYEATPPGEQDPGAAARNDQDSGYTIRVEDNDLHGNVDGHSAETHTLEENDEDEDAPLT